MKIYAIANCCTSNETRRILWFRFSRFFVVTVLFKTNCLFCKVITCSPLLHLSNGIILSQIKSRYVVEDRIYFKCNKGYKLNIETGYVICEKSGLWNSAPPSCVGNYKKITLT